MAARGSTVMQFVPDEVYSAALPPSSPAVGQLWRNTGVNPNELLAWTGNSDNTARAYPVTKSGSAVSFGDLSDDRALNVTVKTVASQAGSGTPTPENVRAIGGKTPVTVTVNDVAHTMPPSAPLYGLPNLEDEIGSGGHVLHQTGFAAFDGSENFRVTTTPPSNTNLTRFNLTYDNVKSASLICSRFAQSASWDPLGEGIIASTNNITIFVLKSRMSGWLDSWTSEQKNSAFKAIVASWASSTPLQVLYALASPAAEEIAPVQINGADGINTVTSDGASVEVEYTGSGWAAVGAVQRMHVEAVSISPEEGLRIDALLGDLKTYFSANSKRFGLYQTDDNAPMMEAGSDGGEGYVAVNRLKDTAVDSDFSVRIGKSHPDEEFPWTGLGMYRGDALVGSIRTFPSGAMIFMGEGQNYIGKQGKGTTIYGSIITLQGEIDADGTIYPVTSDYALGDSDLRWDRLYSVRSASVSSDERLKSEIMPLKNVCDAREILQRIPIYQYRREGRGAVSKRYFGTTAQAVQQVLADLSLQDAELLDDANPDSLGLVPDEFVWLLVADSQNKQHQIDELEQRLAALEKRAGGEGMG